MSDDLHDETLMAQMAFPKGWMLLALAVSSWIVFIIAVMAAWWLLKAFL